MATKGSLPSRQEVATARDDVGAFAKLVGSPMESWQREALGLEKRTTVLVSPRQCGKSRSLSVLAVWWAFRKPDQVVLVVSAGEDAAKRVLRAVRDLAAHPLLSGAIMDETQERLVLSNGSAIRSVPASERQIRGWSTDLLLVDEASFVEENILISAAIPTTAARPDARVVLASTPWGDAGPFYDYFAQGTDPRNPHVATFQWKLADAWWISAEHVEAQRRSMSALRFAAEYEGKFVGAGNAYFNVEDIKALTVDYPLRREGDRLPATCGLDWGRRQDAHAIVLSGLLDDYGLNGRPIVVLPWVETSQRSYALQLAEIESLTKHWSLTIHSETNGVGQFPTDALFQRVGGRSRVVPSSTTQGSKEDAYGRLAVLIAERAIVFPQHTDLLRQLAGIVAEPTPSGGLRIAAKSEATHDDLPDALTLAVAALPKDLAVVAPRTVPEGMKVLSSPVGIQVPIPVRTMPPEVDLGSIYSDDPGAFGGTLDGNPWADVYAPPEMGGDPFAVLHVNRTDEPGAPDGPRRWTIRGGELV